MAKSSLAVERCGSQETTRKHTRYERPGLLTLQPCETKGSLRWLSPLPPSVAILFDFLWLEADERGRVRVSLRDLAQIFRCSRETIRRRLRRLQAAGLVVRYRRRYGPGVIYVRWRPLGSEVFGRSKPEFSTNTCQKFSTSKPQNADGNAVFDCHTGLSHLNHRTEMPMPTGRGGVFHNLLSQQERLMKLKKRSNNNKAKDGRPTLPSPASDLGNNFGAHIHQIRSLLTECLPPSELRELAAELEDAGMAPEEFRELVVDALAAALHRHPAAQDVDPEKLVAWVIAELREREGFGDRREVFSWAGWVVKNVAQPT